MVFFAGTLIHVADVGGSPVGGLAALATDTFAEGLLLPPVRLYAADAPVRDVLRIIERNSRAPDKVIGDVQALVAGVHASSPDASTSCTERYGPRRSCASRATAMRPRRAPDARRASPRIPAGRYSGSFAIDSDGVDPDRDFDVQAAVTLSRATAPSTSTSRGRRRRRAA